MVIHISIYYIVLHYSINSYVPSTAMPASAAAETSFSRLSTGARQLLPLPAVMLVMEGVRRGAVEVRVSETERLPFLVAAVIMAVPPPATVTFPAESTFAAEELDE